MALLDDLKGILSTEEYSKLEGNATIKTRLQRGDELRSFYDGDETVTPPPPAARQSDPPPPPNATFDLSAIERTLDARLSKLDETIANKINEVVQARGSELVNNAIGMATARADELNRVYNRHHAEFGEAFDSTVFNQFLEKPENSVVKDGKRVGSRFGTITEAYDAMTAERRTQKKIDEGIASGMKARSGTGTGSVPGTTPGPGVNSNIRVIMQRGRTGADGQPTSRVERAAAALDARMSSQNAATA